MFWPKQDTNSGKDCTSGDPGAVAIADQGRDRTHRIAVLSDPADGRVGLSVCTAAELACLRMKPARWQRGCHVGPAPLRRTGEGRRHDNTHLGDGRYRDTRATRGAAAARDRRTVLARAGTGPPGRSARRRDRSRLFVSRAVSAQHRDRLGVEGDAAHLVGLGFLLDAPSVPPHVVAADIERGVVKLDARLTASDGRLRSGSTARARPRSRTRPTSRALRKASNSGHPSGARATATARRGYQLVTRTICSVRPSAT